MVWALVFSRVQAGVTSHGVHIGGALPFTNYIICHFGATYMHGMTSDLFYSIYSKGI